MLWDKEEDINISGKNRKRSSIRIKVYLYEVFLYEIIYSLLFYFMTILITFFVPPDLWYLSHYGKGVQKVLSKSI